MPDAYSFGRGTNGPGNITPPMPGTGNGGIAQALLAGRFGSGGGYGYGRGFRGVGRKPGLELPPPPGMEDLTQTQGGFDPQSLYGARNNNTTAFGGGYPGVTTHGAFKPQVQPFPRDTHAALRGDRTFPNAEPGNMGLQSDRLRALSTAAGWAGGLGQRGRGLTQGAGFGQPDDILRRLLMARMGGGGL